MMSYGPLCALCLNIFCFPSCTYEPARKMDCVAVKGKGSKNVIFIIMFQCAYTKSFAGHCDNAMCVFMSITLGSYI